MSPAETEPADWIARARDDLRVAEVVSKTDDLPDWPAGFHLQQAAEKALKAVLIARGRTAPRTHDLEQLASVVESMEPTMAGWADRLSGLVDFGVAQRYPGVPEPSIDVELAIVTVRELLRAASAACGLG